MESPFKKARRTLGLSIYKMAAQIGISHFPLFSLDHGTCIEPSEKILDFLRRRGFDSSQLRNDYREFRESLMEQGGAISEAQ